MVGENETYVTEFLLTGCMAGLPHLKMEIASILLVAYTVTVVGNGLIILVIICNPRLHNPMYFFLCNLSIADFCISSITIPWSVANCLVDRPIMSYPMCISQALIGLFFGASECLFLVVMAYDRYVASSNPLRYVLIMNKTVCILLAIITWSASLLFVVTPCASLPLKFCENNVIDHLFCEPKAIFKLICQDYDLYQIGIYVVSIAFLFVPISFIIFSYARIIVAILRMRSGGSRMKAFSTCGSHLAVVTMFFGAAMFSYLIPQSKKTYLYDKISSAFYAMLNPMFNPLVYTLRNKEILAVLKRLAYKKGDT